MPEQKEKREVRIKPVLRRYVAATRRYPWLFALLVFGIVGTQATTIVLPLLLKDLINTLSSASPSAATIHALFSIVAWYGVISAIGWLCNQPIATATLNRIESGAMADLADEAFDYLMHHSHDFFISNFVGTLTRRVTRYSRAYEVLLDSFAFNFFPTFLFAAGAIGVLWYRNAWLGFTLLIGVIVFISAQVLLNKWSHPLRIARTAEDSRMTGALSDAVSNHAAITHFAGEARERNRLLEITRAWRAALRKSWNVDTAIQSIQQLIDIALTIGLLSVGVLLWQRGAISVGDFALIQVYIIGLISRIWGLGNTLRRVYDAFADGSEMVDILETPHEITDTLGATTLACTTGAITFADVSFSYQDGEGESVLHDYSLEISGGEKVALVGPSGAGKTTVTKLLLRLYDPQKGTICIDDQDIRHVTQESLRKAVAYVPQEPALFHRSLRENIAYGKPDASDEEIIDAAKQAHCHEFISRLPDGYNTYVGERGVKLSGGERQRVAIARAILKNAPILVLDEATSSLDSESEALIQDALGRLMQDKTVIATAHRLSTIMRMDRIIVMKQGHIEQTGTHQELLAKGDNLYQKLWEIQAGGFTAAPDTEAPREY